MKISRFRPTGAGRRASRPRRGVIRRCSHSGTKVAGHSIPRPWPKLLWPSRVSLEADKGIGVSEPAKVRTTFRAGHDCETASSGARFRPIPIPVMRLAAVRRKSWGTNFTAECATTRSCASLIVPR